MKKFEKFGWKNDPFTLRIDPKLFTGYEAQVMAIKNHVDNKHKVALVTGPTGAGKTSFLKWLEDTTDCVAIYVSKPPEKPDQFVGIFTDRIRPSFFERLFRKTPTLFNLPQYTKRKLGAKQLLMLVDEAHETNKDVLEWMRVITDQIDNLTLVIAGMPVLESKIRAELETLDQRITTRVTLSALSKNETKELIRRRIESAGGSGIEPFTDRAIDAIYDKTGGFPREVIKLCDKLIKDSADKDIDAIEASNVESYREFREQPKLEEHKVAFAPKPPSEEQLRSLPYKQRKIMEALSKEDWLTPGGIADRLETGKYKSRGHAVRSVNNILHRLILEGYVQRESRGKAFMYALTPKVKTLFVEK